MLRDKKNRIKIGGLHSDSIYLECDLSKLDWGTKVLQSGFDSRKKSYGSLLGITYYLDKADFSCLLQRISTLMTQESCICFDYQTTDESNVTKTNQKLAAGAGEQMKATYSYDEVEHLLQSLGFQICEHLNDVEATKKYFNDYNRLNPEKKMQAPKGVGYILAVKKG